MREILSKFECNGVTPSAEGYPTIARLNAVYANSDGSENQENKVFSDLTPSGNIEICIDPKAKAHKFFTQGRFYYVRFELIPQTTQEIENQKAFEKYQESLKKG